MKFKFEMIGLFVSDLQEMVQFYTKVLGLDTDWDGKCPYAEFDHEGFRFAMFERKELPNLLGKDPSFPQGLNGTFELVINAGDPHRVDEIFAQLTEVGAKPIYSPRDEPWNMRSAMIADPDGNLIEIASDFWE